MSLSLSRAWALLLLMVMAGAPLGATTVMQFNLAEMVDRAHAIYRGRVLSAQEGTVAIGGGQLNVVTYRIQVDELFRGEVTEMKGVRIAELKMIGKQPNVRYGNLERVSAIPDMPQLTVGRYYLVLATQPSAVGLSSTVGLGQGCFTIYGNGKDETAVNGANNSGLFRGMSSSSARTLAAPSASAGPIPYSELASLIRALAAAGGK
jgi:hypothetical protein